MAYIRKAVVMTFLPFFSAQCLYPVRTFSKAVTRERVAKLLGIKIGSGHLPTVLNDAKDQLGERLWGTLWLESPLLKKLDTRDWEHLMAEYGAGSEDNLKPLAVKMLSPEEGVVQVEEG